MSLFDPAFNPQSSLLQPIVSTPNPVPWLPTHDVAELAPVIDDMAAIPVPWQPRQDLFELAPVIDDTVAIPFAGQNPSDAPLAGSLLGQPLGVVTQSADPVTGLAATQATANSGGVQTFEPTGSTQTFDPDSFETFSPGTGSTWRKAFGGYASTSTDAAYGSFLGPFANGPKELEQDVMKTFNLGGRGGTFSFDFYRFDTWDQEQFKVYANNVEILSSTFGWENNVTQVRTGSTNGYSWTITPVNDYTVRPEWNALTRQSFKIQIIAPTGVQTVQLGFGSSLNEEAGNESYGIDNVSFSSSPQGWMAVSDTVPITSNNAFGSFMGPFAYGPKIAGQDVWKTFDLATQGRTISFDFLRIDSWDGESFKVFANYVEILSSSFHWNENVSSIRTGTTNGYRWTITPVNDFANSGNGPEVWRSQQSFHVTITAPSSVNTLILGFGSTLNQTVTDESYGIDNVLVSSAADGWTGASGAVPIGTNNTYGSFMGPFANGPKVAGQDVWKTFDLFTQGRTIGFDFYRMNIWEGGDVFKVYANDQEILNSGELVWHDNITSSRSGTSASGYTWVMTPNNDFGSSDKGNWDVGWSQQSFRVIITAPSTVNTLKLGFGSTLDQTVADESYGIDNVSVERTKRTVYANDFENNANGFTTQWRDSGIGSGSYLGRFGYNSGTSLTLGHGTPYELQPRSRTNISYDFYRIDKWQENTMYFNFNFEYGEPGDGQWEEWRENIGITLSKTFRDIRQEGSFDLEGTCYYREGYWGSLKSFGVKMHFESYMYGNFGFNGQADEAFHVTISLDLPPAGNQWLELGNKMSLGWSSNSNKNAGWRSWGIDNMLITQDPRSFPSLLSQVTTNAFVASNPTLIVGSSVVVSPLATPVLAPISDPTSFMGLTPDSAAASTSEDKAAARLKPISYWAGLKNSHVAKRLLSLSGARKLT
jgi:hypothetical protein